jgi:hypothetical protein
MNQALTSSLPVAHEPIPAMAVSALNSSRRTLDVSVSAMPFALDTTSLRRANWKPGRPGIERAVCGINIPRLPREARPQQVRVLTRAATFSWNGVAAAPVVAWNIDINVMEVG